MLFVFNIAVRYVEHMQHVLLPSVILTINCVNEGKKLTLNDSYSLNLKPMTVLHYNTISEQTDAAHSAVNMAVFNSC